MSPNTLNPYFTAYLIYYFFITQKLGATNRKKRNSDLESALKNTLIKAIKKFHNVIELKHYPIFYYSEPNAWVRLTLRCKLFSQIACITDLCFSHTLPFPRIKRIESIHWISELKSIEAIWWISRNPFLESIIALLQLMPSFYACYLHA